MRTKISLLWTVVMLNMIFADIFSIILELVNKNTLAIPGDVKNFMAIAAVMVNVGILMIYFSKALPYRICRILNIVAAIITILFIIGGGSLDPHYLIIAAIEIAALIYIIFLSFKWKENEDSARISAQSHNPA